MRAASGRSCQLNYELALLSPHTIQIIYSILIVMLIFFYSYRTYLLNGTVNDLATVNHEFPRFYSSTNYGKLIYVP